MKCPECQNTESIRDCYNGIIYCPQCGLVLTATHQYVQGNKITLPYGFRNSIIQCEQPTNTEYHALWEYYKNNRLEYKEDKTITLPLSNYKILGKNKKIKGDQQ